ncbi:MAG: NADH-quinone oxidoreductase subunit N [Cyanobacteria bacterium NC_groundwater_1444_Ag_S-0.65um_54_12]|nr:NADH-quinone oxidoreductase subunit N [Cyanobacteria bacterium NC_groundwater_1444_Ag_S-0.65um_54_12]
MPSDFLVIAPELLVTLLALGVLCWDWITGNKRILGQFALFGSIVVCGLLIGQLLANQGMGVTLSGMFVGDRLALLLRLGIAGSAALVIALSLDYVEKKPYGGEFYALLLMAVLGAMLAAAAGDLVQIFLAIELLSISSYVLAGWSRDEQRSSEAALKYLLFGGTSSAIFLLGAALLYGLTGTTNLSEISRQLASLDSSAGSAALLAGLLALCGLGYKIAAVPFHSWVPDVYEGAPVPVAAFLSVGSKIAGFAVLIRLLVNALPQLAGNWLLLLAIASVASMTLGNLVALTQTNVKRLLGYSSIAQAGYLLLGLVAAAHHATLGVGLAAVVFYLLGYVFMNLGAFAVVTLYAHSAGTEEIADYAGLARRNPFMAFFMLICMISLAGLPPLVGFWGKFYLFSAIIQYATITSQPIYLWLAVIGLINAVISLYYYMKIPKAMYLGKAASEEPVTLSPSLGAAAFVGAAGAIALFVFPQPVWDLALAAVRAL